MMPNELAMTLKILREQAAAQQVRITQHAQREMVEEAIRLDDLIVVITNGRIIENYPDHRRGACCLVHGLDATGRDIHVVCTTAQPWLIIITAYLPKAPKWVSPTQRRPAT